MVRPEDNLALIRQLGDILHNIGGGLTLYLHQDASADIGGYLMMCTDFPDDAKTEVMNITVTTDDQELEQWVTPVGCPEITELQQGIYTLHCHSYKFSGIKDLRVYFKIYKRILAGAETEIGTSEESSILAAAEGEFSIHALLDAVALLSTDRIVLKIFARLIGVGSNPTIYFYVEGITLVRVQVPVSAIQAADLHTEFKYPTPIFMQGNLGFLPSYLRYDAPHSDVNAEITFFFVAPETRADYKVVIIHSSDTASRTDSGLLYIGAMTNNEAVNYTNIINGENADLINTASGTIYYYEHGTTFSLTAGDWVTVVWKKDNNAGTGDCEIRGMYITW